MGLLMKQFSFRQLALVSTLGLVFGLLAPSVAIAQESTKEAAPEIHIGDPLFAACVSAEAGADLSALVLTEIKELSCEAPGKDPHEIVDVTGLEYLTGLRKLALGNVTFPRQVSQDKNSEPESVSLPSWDNLTHLSIVGAATLPHSLDFSELVELRLLDGTFTTLPSFKKLPKLEVIDLTGSNIEADALKDLADDVRVIGALDSEKPDKIESRESAQKPQSRAGATVHFAASPPADDDIMPDGPLKACATRNWDPITRPATYANTKALTSTLTLNTSCTGLTNSDAVSDWAGAEFLPNIPTLTISGLAGIQPPAEGLGVLFPQLKTLNVTYGSMTELPNFGEMPELTTLVLTGNELTEVSGLSGLPKLTTLTLNSNKINKLESLGGLPSLVTLNATGNELSTLSKLGQMPALTTVNVTNNSIAEVAGLSGLPALATLNLSSNGLEKIESLGGLTALSSLNISSNQVSSISALGSLPALTTLNAGTNQITDISGLARMPKLATLTVTNNAITEVPETLDLPALATLNLATNQITKLGLPELSGVPSLKTLTLTSNKITDITRAGDVPTTLTVTATSQQVTGPTIAALQPNPLSDLITLPETAGAITWRAGANNMAAINTQTGNYAAMRTGDWTLSWTNIVVGKVTYGGTVSGFALSGAAAQVSAIAPELVTEDDDAEFSADVSLPENVDFEYQWYRGTTASNMVAVEGETGATFTIPAVERSDNNAFVKVVVITEGGEFHSANVQLAVSPVIDDKGLDRCLRGYFPDGYSINDLRAMSSVDCSNQGVESINELALFAVGVPVDFSNNLISDISPLVNANGALLRTSAVTNLSGNLISDVTPLARSTVALRLAQINLDRNRVSDVSSMNVITSIPTAAGRGLSVQDQQVGVAGADINTPIVLPSALTASGTAAPLSLNGEVVIGSTLSFETVGLKELTWEAPSEYGVTFSGTFKIPVGVGTSVHVNPESPVGGHEVDLRVFGFEPNELITVAWEDGSTLFEGRADGSGSVLWSFFAPYVSGDKTLTATGESETTASTTIVFVNDEIVYVPDEALRACINSALRLPNDAVPYRTRLDKITGSFDCSNAEVRDLTGIENLPATKLALSGNAISSLDSLATLHETTTELDLRSNEISRLGDVNPQPNLRTLHLTSNQISDFSTLDDMQLSSSAAVTALGQEAELPIQLVGIPSVVPTVRVMNGEAAEIFLPEELGLNADGEIDWQDEGDFEIGFNHSQNASTSDELVLPKVLVSGVLRVAVLDRGDVTVKVNPSKVYPTKHINIIATGYDPGERILITISSPKATMYHAPLSADEWGIVRLDNVFIARNVPAGKYTIKVEGVTSGSTQTAQVEVLPYPVELVSGPNLSSPMTLNSTVATAVAATRAISLAETDEGEETMDIVDEKSSDQAVSESRITVSPDLTPMAASTALTGLGWALLVAAILATLLGVGVLGWLGQRNKGIAA